MGLTQGTLLGHQQITALYHLLSGFSVWGAGVLGLGALRVFVFGLELELKARARRLWTS